jgi:hypothetical protein
MMLAALALSAMLAEQPAPAPPMPVTSVLATLTIKPGIDRSALTPVMPDEVRDTVTLYLEGKIQQWYARGDGRGVVFFLNAKSVEEAKAITDTLPLVKAKLATFEFMTLGPLTPLRYLMPAAPASPKGDDVRDWITTEATAADSSRSRRR